MREIAISDYERLIAFWSTQPGIHLNDADSRANIGRYLARNPGMSFLAEESGQVVATAMAGHDGRRGYLFHVAVAEAHRGSGLAHELLTCCYEALRKQGIAKCYVFLLKDNTKGRGYWENQGWSGVNEFDLMSKWIAEEGTNNN